MFKLTRLLKNLWELAKGKIMSLIYTDKDSANRSNPSLNSDDNVANRMAHGTTQAQNSIDDVDVDRLSIQERQVLAINNGVNKAVFGFLTDGSFGLKVAPDGTDVLTATDDELIFNSSQNVFKIADKVSFGFNISSGAGGATSNFSYTHGLGYKPLIFAVADMVGTGNLSGISGVFILPYVLPALTSGQGTISAFIGSSIVSDTQVYFNWLMYLNSGLSGTITLYLLQETAN